MANDPIGQETAAAAAGDAELFLIDAAAPNDFIHAGHQVLEIVARIFVLNDVPESLAVARAPARIRIEHDVTLRGHPLELVLEDVAVGGVRAAVDVEDERIFFRRVEIGRLLHPRLDAFPIEALVPDLFRLGQVELLEELLVYPRELARLGARFLEQKEIVDLRGRGDETDEAAARRRKRRSGCTACLPGRDR